MHLQSIFSESILRALIDLVLPELNDLILALQVPLDLVDADVLSDVQHDEFIWDYVHLLQGDCLETSAREALNDPASTWLLFFHLVKVVLEEINNDLIFHIRVHLAAGNPLELLNGCRSELAELTCYGFFDA